MAQSRKCDGNIALNLLNENWVNRNRADRANQEPQKSIWPPHLQSSDREPFRCGNAVTHRRPILKTPR